MDIGAAMEVTEEVAMEVGQVVDVAGGDQDMGTDTSARRPPPVIYGIILGIGLGACAKMDVQA